LEWPELLVIFPLFSCIYNIYQPLHRERLRERQGTEEEELTWIAKYT
jgi:hypothetical protein